MAIKQETVTVNGSFANLSISGRNSKSGNMNWTIPDLPEGCTILSTKLTASCGLSMILGSATYTINGTTYSASTSISFELGTSLTSSMNVTAKGKNGLSYGTLKISDIIYAVTYSYDDGAEKPPVITVQSQDKRKISGASGYGRCTVAFTADQALSCWEARATKMDVTPGQGIGLMVESGGALDAGQIGEIFVDCEELTQGDGEYRISVYGKSTGGVWSE